MEKGRDIRLPRQPLYVLEVLIIRKQMEICLLMAKYWINSLFCFICIHNFCFFFIKMSLSQQNSFCLPSFVFSFPSSGTEDWPKEWEFSCWQSATDYMVCVLPSLICVPFWHKFIFCFYISYSKKSQSFLIPLQKNFLSWKNLKTLIWVFLMHVYLNTVMLWLLLSIKPYLLPFSLKNLNTHNICLSFRSIKRTLTLTAVLHE